MLFRQFPIGMSASLGVLPFIPLWRPLIGCWSSQPIRAKDESVPLRTSGRGVSSDELYQTRSVVRGRPYEIFGRGRGRENDRSRRETIYRSLLKHVTKGGDHEGFSST